jgi:hypothetical protein
LNPSAGFDVATIAGLDNCIGDFVFVLNVDTDPIHIISDLWNKLQQGNEVVTGVREDRASGRFRAWLARCYYRLYGHVTGIDIPLGISSPRLYSRKVVAYITRSNDRNVMLKVLPFFSSYRIGTVIYTAISQGDSFGERSTIGAILAGITILLGSSSRPLRLFTAMSLFSSALSLAYSAYVLAISIFKHNVVEGWVSIALPLAVISFFLSSLLGIVAEYVYMLVQQSVNRPAYSIVAESTSSVLEIQRKLNVVDTSGDFSDI